MRIREIIFLVLWLFVGLFINHSILNSNADPLFGPGAKRKVVVKKTVGDSPGAEIKDELKEGMRELKRGLKEGAKELKQAIGEAKIEYRSLEAKLSELDFESGEWANLEESGADANFELVNKNMERLASDSKRNDFKFGRRADARKLVAEPVDLADCSEVVIFLWNGEIEMAAGDSNSVEFDLTLYADENLGGEFEKFAAGFEVKSAVKDGVAKITVGDPAGATSAASSNYAVNGIVRVPKGKRVFVAGSHNLLSIGSMDGGLAVELPRGILNLRGNSGDADVIVRTGKLEINGHDGALQINVSTGDSTLQRVYGGVTYTGGTGKLTASEITGTLTAALKTGDVSAGEIGGSVNLVVGTGRASAYDVGEGLQITLNSGSADARNVEGEAKLHIGTGDLTASNLRDGLFAKTNTGAVSISGLVGDVEIEAGTGKVKIDGVDAAALNSASIEVGTGTIELGLAGRGSQSVEAETGAGRIYVNGKDAGKGEGASSEYSAEGGGARIMLSVKTGNVYLTGIEEVR